MSRRDLAEYPAPAPPPSQCAKVLYYAWRLCSVVFSHFVMISLVVAYCILGAVTFEQLEAENERQVKKNISQIRENTTQSIWSMTRFTTVLNETNWTADVVVMLKDFEGAILREMKVRGWDGNESTEHLQWTFTGALFYSIIVITTIGYGHIAPKTQTGKVVTIFYAILGIPLMLLCLSNIGDVMASSFRFLYWRVCCYVCTRPPKRRHRHRQLSVRRSVRGGSGRGSERRRRPPPPPAALERAHSDTDCRYRDSGYESARRRPRAPAPRPRSQPPLASCRDRTYGAKDYDHKDRSPYRFDKFSRRPHEDENDFPKISLPLDDLEAALKDLDSHMRVSKTELRSRSLPRPPRARHDYGALRDYSERRYREDEPRYHDESRYPDEPRYPDEIHDLHDVDYDNFQEKKAIEERRKRETDDYYYRDRGYDPEDDDYEFDSPRGRSARPDRRMARGHSEYYDREFEPDEDSWERRGRRARSAAAAWGRGAGAGAGAAPRRRLRRLYTVDDSRPHRYTPSPDRDDYSDEPTTLPRRSRPPAWDSRQLDIYPEPPEKDEIKPVPIWLCVCLVASYIVAGTFLFQQWESWAYLDAAYFCFITLTTIGFGDFVPAQGQSGATSDAVHSIALCSLYLLFGIALLAMSFNLVQEEVRANVASLATKLGIIKPRDDRDDDY